MTTSDKRFHLSPAEAARRLAEGSLVLIDVREQDEWDAGHVPGSRHVELGRLSDAPMIPRDRPIAFICLAGGRSEMAARAFRSAGYDAYNIPGGFGAWFSQGLPTEPENAFVAPH